MNDSSTAHGSSVNYSAKTAKEANSPLECWHINCQLYTLLLFYMNALKYNALDRTSLFNISCLSTRLMRLLSLLGGGSPLAPAEI